MNGEATLNVSRALLDLHTAGSEEEFYRLLERLLRELHGPVPFSVFVPAGEEDAFTLEYSSAVRVPRLERPRLQSRELAAILGEYEGGSAPGGPFPVRIGKEAFPVVHWKALRPGGKRPAVLAFHEAPRAGGADSASADEAGAVFAHVVAAFRKVREREALLDLFEETNARLQAIRDMSALLGHLDLESLLSHLIAVYTRFTDAQVGSVVLDDNPAMDVEWGLPRTVLDQIRKRGGPSLAALARERMEPVLAASYQESEGYEPVRDFHVETFLAVPLISSERVLGTVNLVNADLKRDGVFAGTDKAALLAMSSLAATAIENAVLHKESIEKERIKASLRIARDIQLGMYPVAPPAVPGYDLAWLTRSCDETGGDYVDCMPLPQARLALAVGDVSGHGIGAALLMAAGRANLRALLSVKDDLREVMERLNDLLAADMDAEKFMTLFFARLDPGRHEIAYVSAGHDPPLLYRARGGSVADLPSTGLPLGMVPGFPYEVGTSQRLDPGDALLLTTDGVWEGRSPEGEMFGKARLRAALAARAGGTAREIVAGILEEIEAHAGETVPEDDVTLVIVKRVD